MIKNKKVIAILAVSLVLIAFFLYTMVSQGMFFNKGTKLALSGSKSYISPGKLLYSSGSDNGAWVVYLKTGQTVVSFLDKQGNKSWQNVYTEPNLNVNSSKYYTIIGESDDKEVKIINTAGQELLDWQAKGNPLLCTIDNEGTNIVISDIMGKQNTQWLTNLTVSKITERGSDYRNKEQFSKDFRDTEFIDVKQWRDGIVALIYNTSSSEKGQYIIAINNNGEELLKNKVDNSMGDINVSPSGDIIVWSENDIVKKFNTSTNELTSIKHKGVVSCGFLSDTKLYIISNQTGLIPYGRRVYVCETNLAGKTTLKVKLPGYLVGSEVPQANTLFVSTNKGIYAIKDSKGTWYAPSEKEVLSSAVLNDIVYIITKDNSLSWYQKP